MWRQLLRHRSELVTEDGETIRIAYPGRRNGGGGADFCDAVIATSRGLVQGDIEVHVRSSDWLAHGHQHNPAYNNVILHVVMQNNTTSASYLPDGRVVPALAINEFIRSPEQPYAPSGSSTPCAEIKDRDLIAGFLDEAGDARFSEKVEGFLAEMNTDNAEQTLYQGLMEALGYSKNKGPCRELARRLPLENLESIIKANFPDEECLAHLQARLLGTAGLLPSQRPDSRKDGTEGWANKLEKRWAATSAPASLSYRDWDFGKVRPNNFPVRRLAAMSYLLLHYRDGGLLAGIMGLVNNVSPIAPLMIREGLVVKAEGFWADHFDFGLKGANCPLLGAGRASDIVINVLLPFAAACQDVSHGLAAKSHQLYHKYPLLAGNNIEKHMRSQLGLTAGLVNSARRQQGLLHIYKNFCTRGRCGECRLS